MSVEHPRFTVSPYSYHGDSSRPRTYAVWDTLKGIWAGEYVGNQAEAWKEANLWNGQTDPMTAKADNFCLEVLNNPNVLYLDEDKEKFKTELKKLLNEGFCLIAIEGTDKYEASNKQAEVLEAQRNNLEHIVRVAFKQP